MILLTDTKKSRQSMSRSNYMKLVSDYYSGNLDWKYKAIHAYITVKNAQSWELCPTCGLFPKIWEFDNGRSTACGCGENQYRHPSIHAESIMSVVKRSHNGNSALDYDSDALRKNWNHWCRTGEELFLHAGLRNDGKW